VSLTQALAREPGLGELPADPQLPQLALLLDAAAMRSLFEAELQGSGRGRALQLRGAALEKVSYRVGHHCTALYRLELELPGSAPHSQWCSVRHVPPAELSRRHEAALRHGAEDRFAREPVARWDAPSMLVWSFPSDPALQQLPEVIDPESVRRALREHAAQLGLEPGVELGALRCEPIKHMPGKRSVLRFEVALLRGSQPSGRLCFFSKSYRDARSRGIYRALAVLSAELCRAGARTQVPRPLLHLDRLHTFWQEEWPGQALSRLHGSADFAARLPLAATALAELHALRGEGLGPAHYVERTAPDAAEDAAGIACMAPPLAARARAVARRLAQLESGLRAGARFRAVPIHGAFRASQLLERDGRMAVIDLDAAALGDPHFDVAEFRASLLFQAFRRETPLAQLELWGSGFRSHYEREAARALDDARLAWLEAAFLLEKLYLARKNLELRVIPHGGAILDLCESRLAAAGRA